MIAASCYIATIGSYITLSTFITAYLEDVETVAYANAAVLLMASLGRAAGGLSAGHTVLSDGRLIWLGIGLGGSCFLLLGGGIAGAFVVALPLVAMLAISVPFGSIYAMAADSKTADATALAVVIAVGNIAALIVPAVTGWLRELTGGYEAGFLVLAVLNGVALVGIAGRQLRKPPD